MKAIWKNEGEKGAFYNVTITRAYKSPDGTWKHNDSFSLNDLDAVSVVLGHAKVWITERITTSGTPSASRRGRPSSLPCPDQMNEDLDVVGERN